MGHQGGQVVVVAVADLVVGHRVVLVDHRNDAQVEQAPKGVPGVQVLRAVHEVERGQEDLPGHQAVAAERGVVGGHEPALAHRGDGLEGGNVGGTGAGEAQGGKAGGDGPGGDHHHPMALAAQSGHLGGQLVDGGPGDLPPLVGDRRGADLGDHIHDGHTFIGNAGGPAPRSPGRRTRR